MAGVQPTMARRPTYHFTGEVFILLILQLYPLQIEAEMVVVKYLLLMGFNLSWTLSILFAGQNSRKIIRNFRIWSFLASHQFYTTVSQLVNKQPCYAPVGSFLVHFYHSTLKRSSRPIVVRVNVQLYRAHRPLT